MTLLALLIMLAFSLRRECWHAHLTLQIISTILLYKMTFISILHYLKSCFQKKEKFMSNLVIMSSISWLSFSCVHSRC